MERAAQREHDGAVFVGVCVVVTDLWSLQSVDVAACCQALCAHWLPEDLGQFCAVRLVSRAAEVLMLLTVAALEQCAVVVCAFYIHSTLQSKGPSYKIEANASRPSRRTAMCEGKSKL